MVNNEIRFADKIAEYNQNSKKCGIGTIGEKALHAILKNYYEDCAENREVNVLGFVADIKNKNQIIEIQTSNFQYLNKKLEKYLDKFNVTVVYPISNEKNIIWIDPDSGNVVAKNKSPKRGSVMDFLYEASKIRKFLNHKKLTIELLFIDIDEYKLLDGYGPHRKNRCTKLYKIPTALRRWEIIKSSEDLKKLLPTVITDGRFTYAEFERQTKLKGRRARYSLNALIEYGITAPIDKSGRNIIYGSPS